MFHVIGACEGTSLRMSAIGKPYTQNFLKVQHISMQAILGRKLMKKITVTDEKYSLSIRLLTIKNNSHADLRSSHTQLSEKDCQYIEEDSENKILSQEEYIPVKTSR